MQHSWEHSTIQEHINKRISDISKPYDRHQCTPFCFIVHQARSAHITRNIYIANTVCPVDASSILLIALYAVHRLYLLLTQTEHSTARPVQAPPNNADHRRSVPLCRLVHSGTADLPLPPHSLPTLPGHDTSKPCVMLSS